MAGQVPSGPVGMKDIAARAGVSLGTVSHVLNHPERVRPDTRARVEQVMHDLGFVRNESARALRAGRTKTVGYVLLDAGNPFFTDVAAGAQEVTEEAGLSLYMCSSNNQAGREIAYLDRLEEQRVEGIMITPLDPDHPRLVELVRRGTPLVIVDRTPQANTHCSVAVDDVRGGELAAGHLLESGSRRLAFVGGPSSIGQVRDRRQGVRNALARFGDAEQLVDVETDALSLSEGRGAGEQIDGLPEHRRPTAVVCANDLLALGLLQYCVSVGVRVPHDLAIVGYDDIEFAAGATVPLTSVRQPRHRLGVTAAQLLLDEARDPAHVHQQVTFTPQLIARESTRTSRST